MAISFSDARSCSHCGRPICAREPNLKFPHFLPPSHALWRYSDASMHLRCFEVWQQSDEFMTLWWSTSVARPAEVSPREMAPDEFWPGQIRA